MLRTYQLGELRLVQLHDGYGAIDGNRVFYPASQDEWKEGLAPDPIGMMLNAYQPLLITENGQHTLVDTGFGEANPNRKGDMREGLRELGITDTDISRVIITHAHGDHVGGNTVMRDGQPVPAFPNAEYIVQEREIGDMREANDETWQLRLAPVQAAGQLRVVQGEVTLNESLSLWPVAGHTAGQQAVRMSSEGEQAVFVGDLGLSYKNFEHPEWGASWAWSRQEDEANRRLVAQWAIDQNAIVILYHDPRTPWIRLEPAGEGYHAVSIL